MIVSLRRYWLDARRLPATADGTEFHYDDGDDGLSHLTFTC